MLNNADNTDQSVNVKRATDLFRQYDDFIWSVIRSKVNYLEVSQDVYQSFFLVLASRTLRTDVRDIKSYLYRAITNHIIDFAHETAKHRKMLKDFTSHLENSIKNDQLKSVSTYDESYRILMLIRRNLPTHEAETLVLRYFKGYSIGEIAAKMNVKKDTVSSYISAGVKSVRRLANERQGDNSD
jgi:RNA polymerase sigma factor (sigma-70 family)